MIRPYIGFTLVFIPLLVMSGCEGSIHGTNYSSQGGNDYFEEPISESSRKFSAALETSNQFIESLSEGRFADAHSLMDTRLQKILSEDDLQSLHAQVLEKFGLFVEYKPMQWGFSTNSKLEDIVVSIKIVVHENSETYYVLNFEDNGIYDRIVAFNILPRSDGDTVGQAAGWAYGLD